MAGKAQQPQAEQAAPQQKTLEDMYGELGKLETNVINKRHALEVAEKEVREKTTEIKKYLYAQKDNYFSSYGEQTVRSGNTVFKFDLVSGTSANWQQIENLEVVTFDDVDEEL